MTLMVNLAVVWFVGVLAATPAVVWFARDLGRIHRPNWYWTGHHPKPWQWGVLIGWLAGGWVALVIVLVWSQSATRRDVLADAGEQSPRRRSTDPKPRV